MEDANGRQINIEFCKITTRNVLKKDWLGDQKDKYDGSAMICLDVTLNNQTKQTIKDNLGAVILPANFESDECHSRSRQVVLPPGRMVVKFVITIPEAKLWWTWDHGFPHLYHLRLSYMEDTLNLRFGIKDFDYDKKKGFWYLNGNKIFLRGRCCSGDWSREELNQRIQQGINTIRLEAPYSNESIYSWCDEQGIIIWQSFSLKDYIEDEEEIISAVSESIKRQGLEITNHTSIGTWSIETSGVSSDVYFLTQVINETLKSLAPMRYLCESDILLDDISDDPEYLMLLPNVLNQNKDLGEGRKVKEQIEYLRQRKYYPVSSLYYDTQDGVDNVLTPVLISLEPSIHPYLFGTDKVFESGKTFTARVWVINDYLKDIPDTLFSWKIYDETEGRVIASNKFYLSLPPNSAEIPDHIVLPLDESLSGHACIVLLNIISSNNGLLSENTFNFNIK